MSYPNADTVVATSLVLFTSVDAQSLQFLVKMVVMTRSNDEYGEGTRQTPNNSYRLYNWINIYLC